MVADALRPRARLSPLPPSSLQIDEVFRRFSSAPVFVIIDVRSGVEGIPVTAYRSKEEVEGVSEGGREGGMQRAVSVPSVEAGQVSRNGK